MVTLARSRSCRYVSVTSISTTTFSAGVRCTVVVVPDESSDIMFDRPLQGVDEAEPADKRMIGISPGPAQRSAPDTLPETPHLATAQRQRVDATAGPAALEDLDVGPPVLSINRRLGRR
jgi:hypothetical protein